MRLKIADLRAAGAEYAPGGGYSAPFQAALDEEARQMCIRDRAYIDRRPYGTGETVRQLTGYAFEVQPLNDEGWNRLLFFKDGQLVKELVYSWFEWEFPVELLGFTPQTVFRIEANAPRYALSVAEGSEGTAVWQEEGEAAQKAEGGAQSEARAFAAA